MNSGTKSKWCFPHWTFILDTNNLELTFSMIPKPQWPLAPSLLAWRINIITRFTNKEESSKSRKLVPFFYVIWWKACTQIQILYLQKGNQQRKKGLSDCSENDPWSHQEGIEKSCQLSLLKQRLRECFNHGLEAEDFWEGRTLIFASKSRQRANGCKLKIDKIKPE